MMFKKKKIFFVTGTRADYGKIKPIIQILEKTFNVYIFVTGMHLLSKYGSTHIIISKECKNSKIIKFRNQTGHQSQEKIISNTINGFTIHLKKINPDLVIVHGDRIEAFAASIASSINNFLVGHIEGGEISGTIDEHLRHAISKLSHVHFVSNIQAKKRLIKMGEIKKLIFVVGSPDIDVMASKKLPSISIVKKRYGISFSNFGISIYHPVTTDLKNLKVNSNIYFDTLIKSKNNYLIIYPNNDPGSDLILRIIKNKIIKNKRFKVLKSMRFEYFLTVLKYCKFIIGNSSAGIREAPFYGVPTINIGDRQYNRANLKSVKNINYSKSKILKEIFKVPEKRFVKELFFGTGNSSSKINKILNNKNFWNIPIQKKYYSED